MWIRGMCRRVVHGIVHRAAMMRMWWYLQLTMGLVSVYETEFVFRSLMAWGKKLFLSLSVFAIMLLKRLPDGSKQKRWLPGWVESLRIFAALLLQRLCQIYVLYVSNLLPAGGAMSITEHQHEDVFSLALLSNIWSLVQIEHSMFELV